jgi:hypothetical protein
MKSLSTFFQKVLTFLHARTSIGGLEISDSALRAAFFDGYRWQLAMVALPPGVMQGNKILNPETFGQALQQLRIEIMKKKSKRRLNLVVSLASLNVYSQVFTLPAIDEHTLEKAIALNLQMIAPSDINQLYAGWQILKEGENSANTQIFSAFIHRDIAHQLQEALRNAGFVIVALEYKALSLVRLLRNWGVQFDIHKSYIVINLDGSGMDFIVVRNGNLYFEYFVSWAEVQGSEKQISQEVFQAALVRSVYQVVNFYGQHWSDPLQEVIVSAQNIYPAVEKILKEHFSYMVREVKLAFDPPLAMQWHVALGSGMRGLIPRKNDTEVSLLGIGAQEEFFRYQILQFIDFWKLALPAACLVLAISLYGASLFLKGIDKDLESTLAGSTQSGQLKELSQYENQAKDFNDSLTMIREAQKLSSPKIVLIKKIQDLAAACRTLSEYQSSEFCRL